MRALKWSRRDRFIFSFALSFGLGVVVVPNVFSVFILESSNYTVQSLRQGAVIILSTGYSIGALVAMLLNLMLPKDEEAVSTDQLQQQQQAHISDEIPEEGTVELRSNIEEALSPTRTEGNPPFVSKV